MWRIDEAEAAARLQALKALNRMYCPVSQQRDRYPPADKKNWL